MITTVTLNPAIDRTIAVNDFTYGAVNRVGSGREDIGGKGINVAKILRNLQIETKAIGFLGSQNDSHVQKLLDKVHLTTEFVYVNDVTRTNTKIVEAAKGLTTDINEAGFSIDENHLEDMKKLVYQCASNSEFVVLSGSIPKGLDKAIYGQLGYMIKDITKVILDAEGEQLILGMESHPFMIKPNIQELEGIIGKRLADDYQIIEAARELIDKYQMTYVLVSMGGDGSLLIGKTIVLKAHPIRVNVKSTVGAGDSMLAGFIYGLVTFPNDLVMALTYATACGTLAVCKEGTQGLTFEEITSMLDQVQINKV